MTSGARAGRWKVIMASPSSFVLTEHARLRQQHRCVPQEHLELIVDWGRSWRQPGGRMAFFVGRREVALAKAQGIDLSAVRHTAAVLADEAIVVTVIKTSRTRGLRLAGRVTRRARRWP